MEKDGTIKVQIEGRTTARQDAQPAMRATFFVKDEIVDRVLTQIRL